MQNHLHLSYRPEAPTPETASVSDGCSAPNTSLPKINGRKRKSRWDQPCQQTDVTLGDLPPGFSSPCTDAVTARGVKTGYTGPFRPCPFNTLPHRPSTWFTSKEDPTSWSVAPGIPFFPFPPLPPVSHGEFFAKRNGIVCSSSVGNISGVTGTVSTAPNRKREFSSDIGTSYFRQQKRNVLPWIRNRKPNFSEEDQTLRNS
ncbi:hypothetical protein F2Q70_00016312 [Brassica cretica]|uniref:Uncharacterized protein n=1 Tax=Brassica cretica TaxID=69181 RepID=A0A8S9KQ45_BRACR|nr:hypothetical protein F2Q70_00016312 [Brassica cretica]KAF2597450.1 hypothetical protein F2Q68_00009285 [Brassica cretica]